LTRRVTAQPGVWFCWTRGTENAALSLPAKIRLATQQIQPPLSGLQSLSVSTRDYVLGYFHGAPSGLTGGRYAI